MIMPDDIPSSVVSLRPATLGKLIDRMWEQREKKRAKQTEIELLEAQIEETEALILTRLDDEEVDTGRGKKAAVSIGETICFSISDFERFAKYVRRNNYFHLFQRRVSDLAVRELYQGNRVVPGLTPFKRRRINLRSLEQKK